ncbi:hypothetical protein PF005_g11920 [Phytophthora fragariae]|uniref:Uncharacterized protein n=1 Tax=Phytophthora fragariae TaxID=53985 RepID=A0A6A3XVJ6_9STRA|nr:hypothetical protein PF011_g10888 [Phytophthora fragariae]KAE9109315.1 hypothetical protein PF007_g12290 [Phytophthora fragariae]KAE9115641.1 hypothetical protein PF010_g9255 [Phytophthora fragariae]KAE9143967.1 hypothetical protein PF006_g11051 [Phytophthora fragariae]KAE9209197.1 hypothetical protein PF005_g11920 [Phytophthora fragariae]
MALSPDPSFPAERDGIIDERTTKLDEPIASIGVTKSLILWAIMHL